MKAKHLGYMSTIVATMLLSSCTNDVSYDYEGESSYNNELMDVTFTVTAEDMGINTRSQAGVGHMQTVGRASKIDMLIYEVYLDEQTKDESGYVIGHNYVPLTQYGQGNIGMTDEAGNEITTPFAMSNDGKDFSEKSKGRGQTVVNVGSTFSEGGSYSFKLRLMRNQTYTLALWAQSSETDAYDTRDLEKVVVRYTPVTSEGSLTQGAGVATDGKSFLNNDEYRDAFCKSESFSVGGNDPVRNIVLTRPFAQINVATTGADYANLVEGNYVFANHKYTLSQITLKGVAQYLNVVTDKVLSESSDLTDVTFTWNKIPAFINMDAIPGDDDGLIQSDGEEFLYVNLTGHDLASGYLPYKTEWPTAEFDTNGKISKYLTETFKYLSMCYVLVPESKANSMANASSVIDNLKIEFAEYDANGGIDNSINCYYELANVPVYRNWRTNLIGGFGVSSTGTSSIFNLADVMIAQDSLFDGEQSNIYGSDEWKEDHFK